MPDLGWLTEPYHYDFMQRALIAALIVGAIAPLVGTWIVLRRLSYLGDAMSHATVGGVAVAYLGGWSITVGAIGAGLAMAGMMSVLETHPRLREDAIIGAVEAALFAAGIVVITSSHSISIDLTHLLFGSITTVTDADLLRSAALGGGCLALLALLFRDLRAATFDPQHAVLVGIPTGLLRFVLYVLLAITVVLGLQSVGLLMSVALFVIPPAAARLWSGTVRRMAALAACFGVGSSLAGLTISYHAGSAPGATIALCSVAILAISFVATLPRRVRPVHRDARPRRARPARRALRRGARLAARSRGR
ncbi:MAG TPA: metal ABC transporter permease [Conexibacter sp.]|jgi:ABC-type Mn2+/Zn2+ transport system permease subunit